MPEPRAERSPLGRVLETRYVHLGYANLQEFVAAAGVSMRTILDLLTGHRLVFRRDVMTRLNRAWRLPPGTLEQALGNRIPVDVIAEIPAAPTGPDFVAHLAAELAARGAQLPTPAELRRAEGVLKATTEMLAVAGAGQEAEAALAVTMSAVEALAGLLESAGGLTVQQREGLALVDEFAARYPHMTEHDLAKFRDSVMRGKTPAMPAAAVLAAPGRTVAASGR